jgi:hypothetical protein
LLEASKINGASEPCGLILTCTTRPEVPVTGDGDGYPITVELALSEASLGCSSSAMLDAYLP